MQASELGFVHQYLAPEGPAASARTLLMLHGTGGDENDLLGLGRALDPTAGLLSPRGKVVERGMPRFFRRFGEGMFDLDDLRFRADELADFVAAASARYHFDPARVIAVGYSNGANIAGAVLLLRPQALSGAALLRPWVPFAPDRMPGLAGKSVLIAAGRADPIVPADQAPKLADLLRSAGADVTSVTEAQGHALEPSDLGLTREWLASIGGS
jgi:predicted esterase